jgi:hypothetical protein
MITDNLNQVHNQEIPPMIEQDNSDKVIKKQKPQFLYLFLLSLALLVLLLLIVIIKQYQDLSKLKSTSSNSQENIVEIMETTDPSPIEHVNDLFSFSFFYPPEYSIQDKLQLDNNDWKPDKNITLINKDSEFEPVININLDYDGYGPSFPIEIWKIKFDEETKKIEVLSKEKQDLANIIEATGQTPSNIFIITESEWTVFENKGRSLSFSLSYKGEKNQEIEDEFEEIIGSFALINITI